MKQIKSRRLSRAIETFKKHGGILRTSKAKKLGIHPEILYALRDSGEITTLARGLYQLKNSKVLSHPDLVIVAQKIPKAVIGLISALSFHELTTQIPRQVDIVIPRGSEKPRLEFPPIKILWSSIPVFKMGIMETSVDGYVVKIYDPEKSVVDAFRFRNQIGLDVAIEALRFWRKRTNRNLPNLLKYAKVCRVEKTLKPYLESVL